MPALTPYMYAIIIGVVWQDEAATSTKDYVTTRAGVRVPLDVRTFESLGPLHVENSPGRIERGGYCRIGSTMQRQHFRVTNGGPGVPFVEVVRHPADYPFVIHDLIGALRAVPDDGPEGNPASPPRPNTPVEVIEWTPLGSDAPQRVWFSPTKPDGSAGRVGWYTTDASSNGLLTVYVGYQRLQGSPRQVIDQFLKQFPSSVPAEWSEEDWVKDDLDKWSEILRSQPQDQRLRAIIRTYLKRHEREAGQDWGLQRLVTAPSDSEELRSRFLEITYKVEEWRRLRKTTPTGS